MPYRALAEGQYDAVPESWEKLTHQTPVRPLGLYRDLEHARQVLCFVPQHAAEEHR